MQHSGSVELVSRVLNTKTSDWSGEIGRVFDAMWDNFDILVSRGCSMHVHVAPEPQWTAGALRDLVKATGVFDDAIMRIMPADRKMNPWARSNFRDLGADKAQPALKKAFDEVPAKTWKSLFDVLDKIKMVQSALLIWGQTRYVSWNLAPLTSSGTVEFRRPPGVGTPADAKKWVAFTLGFVCAAVQANWHAQWSSKKTHATVSDLHSFLRTGLQLLGWQGYLDPRSLVEDTSPPKTLEWYELEEVKRKKAKAEQQTGFEEKASLVFSPIL